MTSLPLLRPIYRYGPRFALAAPLLLYVTISGLPSIPSFAKFALGICAMLFVPGYLLALAFRLSDRSESLLGFSILAGFLIQLSNIFALYVVDAFLMFSRLDLLLFVTLVTASETLLLIIVSIQSREANPFSIRLGTKIKFNLSAASILVVSSLASNLIFQSFNSSAILPDGSLYLDIARSIASNSGFSSLVVNDGFRYALQNQVGLTPHIGTALTYSFFFAIGNASYQVAKWGDALIGALLVYPVLEITKLSFGKRASLISGILVAAVPLFRYYSVFLYGPEILSAVLVVSSLLMVEWALSTGSLRFSILSSMLFFFSNIAWGVDTVATAVALALIMALSNHSKDHKYRPLVQFLAATILFTSLLLSLVASSNMILWFTGVSAISALLISYRFLRVGNLKHMAGTTLTFLALMQLYLLRFYFFPAAGPFEPNAPYFTLSVDTIAHRFVEYVWPYWYAAALPIVLIPAFLGVIWVTRKALVPYSFLLGWLLATLTLLPYQGSLFYAIDERFYLSITAFSIIFAAGVYSRALSLLSNIIRKGSRSWQFKLPRLLSDSRLRSTLVVIFFLALIAGSTFSLYSVYLNRFNLNSTEANGWTPVLSWIQTNTSMKDIFLTTGSPRLWAWWTDREVVGSNVLINGTLLALDQIGSTEFVHLISVFSADFVVFDSTYQAALLFLPKLSYLYGYYPSGTTFSLKSTLGTIHLTTVISSISAVNNGTVTLYRITG